MVMARSVASQLSSLVWKVPMGYSQKNPNMGVEDMEFPGILEKRTWQVQGSIKNEVEFPGEGKIMSNFSAIVLSYSPRVRVRVMVSVKPCF